MTFEEMLESFLGREIDGVEFTDDDELLLYLNDDAIMVIGAEDDGALYMKRLEPENVN